jgi:hypothetical protein
MGLLSGLLGNASQVDIATVQREFAPLLVPQEEIQYAFKLIRDQVIFTDKRLIIVDKQGVTGKKVSVETIPYQAIVRISKQSAGFMDLNAELFIWVKGESQPIVKKFDKNSANVNELYQLISIAILPD